MLSTISKPKTYTSPILSLFTYDKNGNFLKTNGISNSWDYNNRLISSYKNNITTNYSYDYTGNRVYLSNKFGTTYYPTNYYNIYNDPKVADSTKKTKHIFGNGELIATVETTYERDEFNHLITIITPYYINTDHLGSTNTVSSNSGSLVETLDYYPYGNPRISSGSHTEQRQYIGEVYDSYTDLNYLNARYYDSFKGRFISQDPMFWRFSNDKKTFENFLTNPQSQNSYSYANGNPISNKDPNGEWSEEQKQGAQYLYENSRAWRYAMDNPWIVGPAVGVVGGVVAYGSAVGITALSVEYLGGAGTACIAFCNQNGQKLIEQGIPNLQKLESIGSAVSKIVDKGSRVGINGVNNFINEAQKGVAYLDTKSGYINIFTQRANDSGFLRITLNPEMTRIISAGLNQTKDVVNGIGTGRFVEIISKLVD